MRPIKLNYWQVLKSTYARLLNTRLLICSAL